MVYTNHVFGLPSDRHGFSGRPDRPVQLMRYVVTIWHGASGTLYYVVDRDAPEADQPAVLKTHHDLEAAKAHAARLNR